MNIRTKLLVFLVCILSIFPLISFKGEYTFKADELFGEGSASIWQVDNVVFGFFRPDGAWHNWVWIIYGEEIGDCKLIQITGDRVTGVVHGYVPCEINLHKWQNRGTIDFRGDPERPFITKKKGV